MNLYSCRSISLNYIKYGETSIIAKLFTEKKGLQSFIIKGIRSVNSKKKLVCFQPMQLAKITANYFDKKNLQNLKNISIYKKDISINQNPKKILLSLFISEVLSKLLRDNVEDKKLFEYVWKTKEDIISNDIKDKNFVLLFLLNISVFFGFPPLKKNMSYPFFDMKKGMFVKEKSSNTISEESSCYLKSLLLYEECSLNREKRKNLLDIIINYYKIQEHELKNLTSHLIIDSILV
tara:strand:+ start:146 stop:850 length:705 start_codon:yes stop_codon:yes gene_type:complete